MAANPDIGTVVHESVNLYTQYNSAGTNYQVTVDQYKVSVQYQGYFPFVPSAPGAFYSSPSPSLHYKYSNRVYMKKPSGWVEIPIGNYPWNAKPPATFWSAKTPAQLYGWKPTPTLPSNSSSMPSEHSGYTQSPGGVSDATSTSSNPAITQVAFVKRPKGVLATNPPLHVLSRGNLHFDRKVADSVRLGVISLPSQIRSIANAKYSKNWGFRFLYNPTAYGYSQTTTDGVMPEQVTASRTDLLIPATSSYSLELYLNRIPDMNKRNQSASYYNPRPSMSELGQLWTRGTEYDLDYLYRVINGDPKTIVGWKKSANIGALIMQRVQLKLGNGLYITGVINSINVQHVMFTNEMLPMFSTVTIDFTQWFQEFKK